VQDIVVVAVMIVLSSVDPAADVPIGLQLLAIVGRGALLLGGLAALSHFVLPRITHVLARQGELLVLASVAWAVALAAVAVAMGFSAEVGAFLAGASLASSGYREAISGRLATLRDFVLVFFFIREVGVDLVIRPLHGVAGPSVALMHAEDRGPPGLAGPLDEEDVG
jgi:Kef-type K+ transport system membrane component KefB